MDINIIDTKQQLSLSDDVFNCELNEGLLHQVVTAYRNNARAGTKAQKTRSEVRGGGAKPWRQKGTGRARAGTIRSPIWRSGGVTFAAKPRDYSVKVNKKMYRGAMCSAWSELMRLERVKVLDKLEITEAKTKTMMTKLRELGVDNALIIVNELNEELYYSARNIPNVDVIDFSGINPVSLLSYENIIITTDALKKVEEQLG